MESMRETAPQEVHSRRANYRGQIGETLVPRHSLLANRYFGRALIAGCGHPDLAAQSGYGLHNLHCCSGTRAPPPRSCSAQSPISAAVAAFRPVVSCMEAYTVLPARANAVDANRPKPREALVTTMILCIPISASAFEIPHTERQLIETNWQIALAAGLDTFPSMRQPLHRRTINRDGIYATPLGLRLFDDIENLKIARNLSSRPKLISPVRATGGVVRNFCLRVVELPGRVFSAHRRSNVRIRNPGLHLKDQC